MSFGFLTARSCFSAQDSLSSPEEFAARAKELGHSHLGLADFGTLMGAVRLQKACTQHGLHPVFGLTVRLLDPLPTGKAKKVQGRPTVGLPLSILALNEDGWRRLGQLVNRANERVYFGPTIGFNDLGDHDGLVFLAGPSPWPEKDLRRLTDQGREVFLSLEDCALDGQEDDQAKQRELSELLELPLVAAHRARYIDPRKAPVLRVLHSSATGIPATAPELCKWSSDQQHLLSEEDLTELHGEGPVQNAKDLLDRFTLQLDLKTTRLPSVDPPPECPPHARLSWFQANFPTPHSWADLHTELPEAESLDHVAWFRWMAQEGLHQLLGADIPGPYQDQLDYELSVIENMGFPSYFLIVSEYIIWAKNNDIGVGAGRGSGAGSVASWCLAITGLDPLEHGLTFERFLNPGRKSLPDVDTDFEKDRRYRVINHIRDKYGSDCVAQIATAMACKLKVAWKDASRALRVHPMDANAITTGLLAPYEHWKDAAKDPIVIRSMSDPLFRAVASYAANMASCIRQIGIHAGGVIISDRPLNEIVPVMIQDGKPVVGLDMNDAEAMGLVKFDILGLVNLDIMRSACDEIERTTGQRPVLDDIPWSDPETLKMLSGGDGYGVFQVEGYGMRRLMKAMEPSHFRDLAALVALFRPGPLKAGMDLSYVERKHGREKVQTLHPLLDEILSDTYGVLVYQEQVLQMAQKMAGYSLADADLLRRAVGKKKLKEMLAHRTRFIEGGVANGIDQSVMETIWDQIKGFASYGFNRAHAASYARITAQTAWLKTHHPVAFLSAVMTWLNVSSKAWPGKVRQGIEQLRDRGFRIEPPSVNHSDRAHRSCMDEQGVVVGMRWGLQQLKGLEQSAIARIILERKLNGPFSGVDDFRARVPRSYANRTSIKALAASGAFDEFGVSRSALVDLIRPKNDKGLSPFQETLFTGQQQGMGSREAWSWTQRIQEELSILGSTLRGHPLDRYRFLEAQLRVETIDDVLKKHRYASGRILVAVVAVYIDETPDGRKKADVVVTDRSGTLLCKISPQHWSKSTKEAFKVGSCLEIIGRFQPHDSRPQLRVSAWDPLASLLARFSQEVCIEIEHWRLKTLNFRSISSVLASHPGPTPINIDVTYPDRTIRLRIKSPVTISESLMDGLEQALHGTGFIKSIGHQHGLAP